MESLETCLLCGSRDAALRFTSDDRLFGIARGKFSLVECGGCGLMRLSPRPGKDAIAGFYASHYWFAAGGSAAGRLEEAYRRAVLLDHVRFASRAARKPGPVLDVGCGGGLFLRMMADRGFDVLGVDFSQDAARVAWEQHKVRVLVGDLADISIATESCGLVTMYHVLEHLPDPAAYLRTAARLVQPDGRLIVQVPDRDCWEAALLGPRWTGLDVPRHIHVFRSRDLRALLQSTGFEIVREKHFSLRDHPAGLATGIAPALDPMARGIRGSDRSGLSRLIKDLAYFGLTVASLPFTLLESLFGKGSSVMIEARKTA